MPVHDWQRRRSPHFGELWVPYVLVHVLGKDRQDHILSLQIDSGAVVSLLQRSLVDLLGVELEGGSPYELTAVGGAKTLAYVHYVETSFSTQWAPVEVPFAIADREDVPNLLGRMGVFDRFHIHFDPERRETRIEVS